MIKTGRVLVEKGQVDYPEHVSKQIDRLKIAYNEFGSQVTEGKTDLEKALKISKNLRKELTVMYDWVDATTLELDRKNNAKTRDVDEEINFVATSLQSLYR